MATHTDGATTLPGQEPVYNIAPGRAAALKLQSVQTGESVMVFEEVAPAGADTECFQVTNRSCIEPELQAGQPRPLRFPGMIEDVGAHDR